MCITQGPCDRLTHHAAPPTITLQPEWRNWQTRGTQNPVSREGRVGSTPSSGTKWQGILRGPLPFGLGSRVAPMEFAVFESANSLAALVRPGAALPQRSPRYPDWRAPPSVRRTAPRQAWPGFTTPSSGAKEQKPLLVEGPLSSVYRIARSIACGGLSPSRAHVARPSEACRPRGDGALPLSPCACAAGTLGYRSRRRLRGSPLPSS